MNALLLVAHGSRKRVSNDEIRDLTRRLAQDVTHGFDQVECAFLEFTEPSITEGISICSRKGATHITVLPYFLSSGHHVTVDIPAELENVKKINPQVQLQMAPYLGAAKEIGEILVSLSRRAT